MYNLQENSDMSTTFKAVVYAHHRKEDGTYNVKIRVTHNRKRKHLPTSIFVTKEDLTRGLKIKNAQILDTLKHTINAYQKIVGTLPIERANAMSVEQVVEYMQNYNKNNGVFELDFIAFGRQVVADTMAAGRVGTARSYETAINALVRYLKRDTLSIHEVTVKLLTDFCNWVREQPARPNREKRDRAPSLYLGNIRILHNKAKAAYNDEDAGIIRIPLSPFKRFHVPRQPLTRKRSITIEQLQAIMRVPRRVDYPNCKKYATSRQELARDMFLLSFGLIGMNSVDMYNCTSIEGDRITYQRTKTTNRRADHATISIKIEPCVMPLVEKYRDRTGKRVFDFYQRYSTAQGFNCYINRGLKLIGKMEGIEVEDLEFYAARHTWATLARNKAEIDKATIHEALNHVDEQMRITDIYIDRDYSQQDEANKRVLELVGFTAPVD